MIKTTVHIPPDLVEKILIKALKLEKGDKVKFKCSALYNYRDEPMGYTFTGAEVEKTIELDI